MALVMVLVAVAVLSLASLIPLRNQQQAVQRERERELLFIGNQFREAIASYVAATPGGVPQFPKTLSDLLEDKRFPNIRRHLRRVYADPMTGLPDWTLLMEQGAIVGVASRSARLPLKRGNFAAGDREFANAASYADWKFMPGPALSAAVSTNADGSAPPPVAGTPNSNTPAPAQPVTPAPPPVLDHRVECARAYSSALNVCVQDQATASECRARARETYLACLHG